MKTTTHVMAVLVGVLLVGAGAVVRAEEGAPSAGTPAVVKPPRHTRHVRARQERQRQRIKQGVKSGELTKDEAHSLRTEEKQIQDTKQAMVSSDGKLDKTERKELNTMQDKASQDIYTEKHDAEKR